MELIKINSARDEANAIHTHARPGAGNSSKGRQKINSMPFSAITLQPTPSSPVITLRGTRVASRTTRCVCM